MLRCAHPTAVGAAAGYFNQTTELAMAKSPRRSTRKHTPRKPEPAPECNIITTFEWRAMLLAGQAPARSRAWHRLPRRDNVVPFPQRSAAGVSREAC
jgi:hypothetical protein